MEFIGLTPEGTSKLDAVKQFVASNGIPWPNGYGARSTLQALGIRYFPTLIVVDAEGRIAWRDEMGGDLQQALDRTLAEAGR